MAGLTVDALDTFALWARGKLSVSTGGASDELLFEADPVTGRLRAWGDAAIDGHLDVAGELQTRSVRVAGGIDGEEVAAGRIVAGSAELSGLDAQAVTARGATVADLAAERMKVLAALFEGLEADAVEAGKVTAAAAEVEGAISAASAEAGSASFGT